MWGPEGTTSSLFDNFGLLFLGAYVYYVRVGSGEWGKHAHLDVLVG